VHELMPGKLSVVAPRRSRLWLEPQRVLQCGAKAHPEG
jgi:hypothetical protein